MKNEQKHQNDIFWVFRVLFLLIITELLLQLPPANNLCKLARFLYNLNNRVDPKTRFLFVCLFVFETDSLNP